MSPGYFLVRNHAFIDGNKRVALACAILFFKMNRVFYSLTEEEAVELTLAAAGGQMDKGAVAAFFRKHLLWSSGIIKACNEMRTK